MKYKDFQGLTTDINRVTDPEGRIWVYESGKLRSVELPNGEIIDIGEIENKINNGDYGGAVKDVLLILGYSEEQIKGNPSDNQFGLDLDSDGTIDLIIEIHPENICGGLGEIGSTSKNGKGTLETLKLFGGAFFDLEDNASFVMLFHTIGHEMVHVKNRLGNYYNWDDEWRDSYDEVLAFSWNLVYLDYVSWEGALDFYSDNYTLHMTNYMKAIGINGW
jgi:hypothetical protein